MKRFAHIAVRILLLDAALLGVVGIVGLLRGWDTADEWSNGIFVAGGAVAAIGTAALMGGTMTGSPAAGIIRGLYLTSLGASRDGVIEGLRKEREYALGSGAFAVVAGTVGIVAIGAAWLVRLF